jgi:hypothetical protein
MDAMRTSLCGAARRDATLEFTGSHRARFNRELDMKMEWMPLVIALVSLVLSGFCTVLWFLYLSVRQDARDALRELALHKLHVAETCVTKDGLEKAIASLDQTIGRLIDAVNKNAEETRLGLSEIHRRIDGKADKP